MAEDTRILPTVWTNLAEALRSTGYLNEADSALARAEDLIVSALQYVPDGSSRTSGSSPESSTLRPAGSPPSPRKGSTRHQGEAVEAADAATALLSAHTPT